jgi:hypothetical protein
MHFNQRKPSQSRVRSRRVNVGTQRKRVVVLEYQVPLPSPAVWFGDRRDVAPRMRLCLAAYFLHCVLRMVSWEVSLGAAPVMLAGMYAVASRDS